MSDALSKLQDEITQHLDHRVDHDITVWPKEPGLLVGWVTYTVEASRWFVEEEIKACCFLAIACKRPGGRLLSGQPAFLHQVKAAGGIAMVARSVEDVIERLGDA